MRTRIGVPTNRVRRQIFFIVGDEIEVAGVLYRIMETNLRNNGCVYISAEPIQRSLRAPEGERGK